MSRYRTTMKELLEKVYKEDGHQDVSSSKRMCKTIVEDAQQIESKLNSMSPEDSLDTWWTNKLAVSANNLNKARDYIVNDIKEELELDEGKMKTIATMFDQGQSAKEIAKKLKLPISTVKAILGEGINPYISMQRDSKTGKMNYVVLDKDEKEAFSSQNYILAKDYLKKNYNKLKEEVLLEFSDSMLDKLEREYAPLKGKTISVDQANKLRKIFDRIPDRALSALRKRKIPFLSGLALSRMIKKGMPVKDELELDENRVNDIKKKAKEFGVDVSVDAMGPFKSKQVNVKGFKTQSGMNKFMKYVADMGKDFLTIKDEVELKEYKKMKVIFPNRNELNKAKKYIIDLEEYGFDVEINGLTMKVDSNGQGDLNKYGTDFKNFHNARIVAEETEIEESAAAAEIQRTNTRRDSMDYGMYKKAIELLRTKQYAKLGKHIYDAETAPREYVMGVIDKKEPKTFKKIYGNQSGYYSLMKPKLKEEIEEAIDPATFGPDKVAKAMAIATKSSGNYSKAVRDIEKIARNLSKVSTIARELQKQNESLKEEEMPKDEPKKDNEKKEAENKDKQIAALKDQISMLKTKIENEKNKAVKPEPNPDTGEVPLTVGVAYKHFKDKMKKEETLEEMSPAEKKKRLQRAKDMIKYYDMMKKKALKGPNKALAKKMLKSELEEATIVSDISGISITALKRETAKFNIKVARVTPGGPMGAEYEVTFTGREQDLIRYAKEHFGFDDKPGTFQQLKKHLNMDYVPELKEATKNTDFKVKMKTSSGMKTVRVTVPIKDFVVDMAKIEDAARKKVKGDMVNFDFVGDIKMEADLTKKQVKMVHKVADDLPKKDFKDRYGKEKGDAVRFGTATNMVKKKLGIKENTSAFNPSVHNKVLGVTSKDLDRAFNKLSQRAQSHVNDLLRTGMGTRDAIKKAKEKFKEGNISEDKRLYVETIAGLKKKAEKSGMPYSILKKVYDRGMAAWKSGHRPGATQQQWAFARVNSFVTKSSGTWGGADKDLAKQVRGSK